MSDIPLEPVTSMPSTAPPADQFWLLTGPVPSGPFTVGEIHSKLATGDASWQTPACPVGGAQWLPLVQTPGIGPGTGATEQSAEPAVPAPVEPAPLPSVPSLPADEGATGTQPQSTEPPRNDAAPRSAKQVAEAVGGIAALLLVGGLIWGAKCAEEAIRGPRTPTVPVVSQSKVDPAVVARFANTEAAGKASVPQAPNVPPPDRALDPARRLVGSWRWTAPNGYASTFSFESNGAFTYYVTSSNPLANLPAAAAGEAVGRWSVRDGTLFLEFTGGTTPTTDVLFRGSTGRSPVRFVSDSAVQLSGVEGDAVTRTYNRVR